jgi:CO/xanthine dehydrogenase Mo-binding subunit
MDVTILESPCRQGPFGAKGVGEMPMSGPGPAVANACRHLGLDIRSLPITPEKVLECASSSTESEPASKPRR